MFDDLKIKFCFKIDWTLAMHFARDFALCVVAWFLCHNALISISGAIGFNLAWEWQDGLHNDGFNPFDFAAGLAGVLVFYLIFTRQIGLL